MLDFAGLVLHLDQYLAAAIQEYGLWVYVILFLIIFLETGLVVTPFLPGDSLLFVAGALAGAGLLNIAWLFVLLAIAAIAGDTANYWLGRYFSDKVLRKEKIRFVKKEHLTRARDFYEKHGSETIIIARFLPLIRTFAPFVAGVAKMKYRRFISYNVIGGLAWVIGFLTAGYYFGNIPVIRENLGLVITAIIIITVLIAALEFLKHKSKK